MSEAAINQGPGADIEDFLRGELAHADLVLESIAPVLGHLLANHDHSLFSDEIVSRVRAMTNGLARQVLAAGCDEPDDVSADTVDALAATIAENPALLTHCHALALEWQLAMRLEARAGIDPVLPPMVQALIASDDAATASTAMAFLAAQARFIQQQRRMELPLGELPADLFDAVLAAGRACAAGEVEDRACADERLRDGFDESASRTGLMSRLVSGLGGGVGAAISLAHAGVALFVSALAKATDQQRDLVVISTNDRQLARLALALRAAGLKPQAVAEQFAYLHPDVTLPEGFDILRADKAAALLAGSAT